MTEQTTRHLTSEEKVFLKNLCEKSGFREVLGAIAQAIMNDVPCFSLAESSATEIKKVGRKLGQICAGCGDPGEKCICDWE